MVNRFQTTLARYGLSSAATSHDLSRAGVDRAHLWRRVWLASPVGFILARLLRQEDLVTSASCSEAEALAPLQGKTIALVGNARSLADSDYGAEIDGADIVIRLNAAPAMTPRSHGVRCDLLGLAVRLSGARFAQLGRPAIWWMSPRLHRLSWYAVAQRRFFRYPLARHAALRQRLGPGPSTGISMIDMLARSDMAELRVYGFDFFASNSFSKQRAGRPVPHNFAGESDVFRELMARDPRISHRRSPVV